MVALILNFGYNNGSDKCEAYDSYLRLPALSHPTHPLLPLPRASLRTAVPLLPPRHRTALLMATIEGIYVIFG